MIDSVPLIQNANDAQQINASIIAMKKASRELDEKIVKLNSLNSELDKKIALLDSGLNKEIEDRKEAINSLDVSSVGGSGKYISAISETDGKISATASEITSTVSSGNSQPVTSGGVYNLTSTNTNTSKTDANLCYSDSTRVEFFRLPTNASNCPPSNNKNPTYIEAFTFNDGTYIRVTQKAYDNYSGVASYIRSGYSDANNITWSDWQSLTPINGVISGSLQPVTSWAVYNALGTKANKIKTSGETTIDKVYEKLDGSNVYLKNGMNQIAQNIASYTTGQFVDINTGSPRYCFVIYKLDNTYWSAELRSCQSAYNNIVFKFGHENTGYFGVKIY